MGSPSASTTNPDGAALPRIEVLDGVRGVAILLTLMFHSWDTSLSWAILGERGVDLFFVLSGFLITGILIETRTRPNYFRNFIARRAVRILPLYYLFIVGMLVVLPQLLKLLPHSITVPEEFTKLQAGPDGLWTVWVYLQNFVLGRGPKSLPGLGHLWSLAVEEQFYLFWPVVIWFLPAERRFRAFVVGVLGTMVLRTVLLWTGVVGAYGAREYTFNRLDTLLLGAIGALYLRDADVRRQLEPLVRWFSMRRWIFPILVIGLLPNVKVPGYADDFFGRITYGPGLTIISMMFLAYVLRAAQGTLSPRLERFTSWRFNLILGKYSYAIYLFHYPIAHVLQPRAGGGLTLTNQPVIDSVIAFVLTTAASLAIARVTWTLWEQPWLRLKRRFSY
ncbi:MAG: acyltransferase [Acidimicrobiales bacterium]